MKTYLASSNKYCTQHLTKLLPGIQKQQDHITYFQFEIIVQIWYSHALWSWRQVFESDLKTRSTGKSTGQESAGHPTMQSYLKSKLCVCGGVSGHAPEKSKQQQTACKCSKCSQKHAYRAPDRQQSGMWGQSVTLVRRPDTAARSWCFDSTRGLRRHADEAVLLLRTSVQLSHEDGQMKTSKWLMTLIH